MPNTDPKTMLSALPSLPSTPLVDHSHPLPPNRRLWSSPAISDYFSGDDCSAYAFSPESSLLRTSSTWDERNMDRKLRASALDDPYMSKSLSGKVLEVQQSRSSQMQRELLSRLNAVARAIIAADLTEHHCEKLGLDVDRLESTLAAPDSQSREPAEVAEVGLFVDDEAEETDVESTIIADKSGEASEVIARVVKAAKNLKDQFTQLKHVNDIATEKLEAAAQEITRLRNENISQGQEDPDSELLYLKLRLNMLEERSREHLARKGQESLLDDIQQLNSAYSPLKPTHGPKYPCTPGATNKTIINGELRGLEGSLEPQALTLASEEFSEDNDDDMDQMAATLVDATATEEELENTSKQLQENSKPRRTPWQMLWDDLADFAGIHNEYSSDKGGQIDDHDEEIDVEN